MKVLVIDDEDSILLSWRVKGKSLGANELMLFPSMETCSTSEVDYPTIDIAYVDKNIPGTKWTLEETISFLRNKGVKKIVVATGEVAADLTNDPACKLADGVAREKIPASLG